METQQQRSDEVWAVINEAHALGIRLIVDQESGPSVEDTGMYDRRAAHGCSR